MVSRLIRSPILFVSTPRCENMGRALCSHRIVSGKSPFDAWHVNWTLSPLFASSSNANGWMCGKTEYNNRRKGKILISVFCKFLESFLYWMNIWNLKIKSYNGKLTEERNQNKLMKIASNNKIPNTADSYPKHSTLPYNCIGQPHFGWRTANRRNVERSPMVQLRNCFDRPISMLKHSDAKILASHWIAIESKVECRLLQRDTSIGHCHQNSHFHQMQMDWYAVKLSGLKTMRESRRKIFGKRVKLKRIFFNF